MSELQAARFEGAEGPDTQGNLPKAILIGGLAAGVIDICYAFVAYHEQASPMQILQSVASGMLGASAFEGGTATALIGALLHFTMTIIMAAIFVGAARRFGLLARHVIVAGLIYGAIIYFGMRLIIVPLSRYPAAMPADDLVELAVHVIGVGLVIALAARRYGLSR